MARKYPRKDEWIEMRIGEEDVIVSEAILRRKARRAKIKAALSHFFSIFKGKSNDKSD